MRHGMSAGKTWLPSRTERQRHDRAHRRHRQAAVEMRKERAAARRLPAELLAERLGVDRDEEKVAMPGEMPRRRLAHLLGGGEMDVAVGEVDRRAVEAAGLLGLPPLRFRTEL